MNRASSYEIAFTKNIIADCKVQILTRDINRTDGLGCNRRVETVNATSVRYTNEYGPQAESGTPIHKYAI